LFYLKYLIEWDILFIKEFFLVGVVMKFDQTRVVIS